MTDTQIGCLGALDLGAQAAAEFEIIWDIYPKRVSKPEGLAAYTTTRNKERFRVLLVAVRAYKKERKGEDQKFTLYAGTFFGKKRRYADYPEGKTNGETERKDGKWEPSMTKDLQALAKKDEEERKRQTTSEDPTTDHNQTEMKSVEDRMADL